jgi:hypothetical protein
MVVIGTVQTMSMSVGFEVLTAASMKLAVLWVVVPCSLGRSLPTFQMCLLPPSSGPCTSETLLYFYQTTLRSNPEDSHLNEYV